MEQEAIKSAATFSSAILTLAPVIVGGLLAIGGALSGTLLTYLLTQRAQRKKLKREKLEQLLSAANRTEHWLDEYKNTKLDNIEKDIGASPISEVEYLSALYVKELAMEVSLLSLATAKYFKLVANSHAKRLETGSIPKEFIEGYKVIYPELSLSISNLVKKAAEVADEL